MHNKLVNKKKKGLKNGRAKQGFRTHLIVYRGPHFMPDRYRTTLRYEEAGNLTNVGFINANIRFQISYLSHLGSGGGVTAVPGFSELAGLYRFYRVNGFRAKCLMSNQETFAVQTYICPTNADPGINTASFTAYLSSRDSVRDIVGPLTGMGVSRHTLPMTTVASFGGSATYTDMADFYSGQTGAATAPANSMWFMLGALGSAVYVNGIYYSVSFDLDVDFFELGSPAT